MRKKILSFIGICLLCNVVLLAQTKVLTTDGKVLMASSIELTNENVLVSVDDVSQTIAKSNVLAVIPKGNKAYTFRIKNNKKLTIKKGDIYNNYEGADKPRIFAYKYLGSKSNIGQLYTLNGDNSLNEEQFKNIYNEQQQKFKTRNTLSLLLAVGALLLGAISLSNSMKSANSVSSYSLNMGNIAYPFEGMFGTISFDMRHPKLAA